MRVIVVGAGVIGASVAFRLAQGGASVLVLERDRVGGGTSGSSFAWTNSNNKPPRAYHDLNLAGMRAHAALRDELGAAPWLHGGGSIEWEAPEDQPAQTEKVARLQDWGYRAQWLTSRELGELEPDIDRAVLGDAPVAYFPDEGWLDPVPFAHAMIVRARGHGATLCMGVSVSHLVARAGRIVGVRTADDALHEADAVVNCAGRWAAELVCEETPGPHPDPTPAAGEPQENSLSLRGESWMRGTAGLLVLTPPVAASLQRVVRTPLCDLRPDGAGRLMLIREASGSTAAPFENPGPASEPARDLVGRAARLLPCIGPVQPEATRVGIRPIPRDGFPAIGPMPGPAGSYVAVTHSGVTLSAFIGTALAGEVLTGRERPELAPFRPARLFN